MSETTTPTKGPISWMAGHTVAANLLMAVFLVGGLLLARGITKEVFPDFELDLVNISVAYPGASPEEVERGIILAVEEAVQSIEGVAELTAKANENSGTVTVEVLEGADIQRVSQDIKNAVDRITSFPEEIELPQVSIVQRRRYVVSLALYGNQPETTLRETAEHLRDRLLADPDIDQVDLAGIRPLEISIEIPQAQLRAYRLTLDDVAGVIARAAVELPGGAIKTRAGEVLVRMNARRDQGYEYGQIPIITTSTGTVVRLADIAAIRDGFAETDSFAQFNGKPAVMIEVYRVGDQTPLSVADAVKRLVAELGPTLPPGLALSVQNDRSEIYRQRMDLMLRNGYLGLSLVFVLLAVFLELRLAFWVSLGIPVSLLGSFFLLTPMGLSINLISMFAFIVTLGIVVDDAIVAGENMYRHRQQGKTWLVAAVDGTREIAVPVTFSVLTNIVAFMPLYFVPGFMGKVFGQIPIVVLAVFTVSLVESLLILPAHIGHRRDRMAAPGLMGRLVRLQQRFSMFFLRLVHRRYGPLLAAALKYRYITMSVGIAILLLTAGYVRSGRMGFELFPRIESDYSVVEATLPYGTAVETTMRAADRLTAAAEAVIAQNGGDALSQGIFSRINGNIVETRVYLTPPEVRPVSTAVFTQAWRKAVGPMAGLESLRFYSDFGGPGRGPVISVELSHRDVAVLEQAGQELAEAMGYFPFLVDIDDGYLPGKQQIDFRVRPEARSLGMTARDVANQVRHAYYGAEALRQQRGRNEVKVMVRLPISERVSEHNLEQMILRTPAGREIPLMEAVSVSRGRAYTGIDRRNGRRVITVTADSRPRSKADQAIIALKADTLPALQTKYPGLTYSFEGRQADRRESMQAMGKGLLMALLIIFAMLAVPFNSFSQPLIIMGAIPFGAVGAVVGHLIMGFSLSVMSVFGLVALTGVVINDALVMVDFANRLRRGGAHWGAAVHAAGIQRFRPILLTTLTTFGGLAPMIFETSRQARFLIPMALSLGFGILFATAITLILVPCLYGINEDLRHLLGLGKDEERLNVEHRTSNVQHPLSD